jgi:hypothetical protein
MHQGSMFSSQWNRPSRRCSGMIFVRPSRTASSAGPTIFSVSTNHWSVSIGSITTLERSPKGCMILSSTSGPDVRTSSPGERRRVARPDGVIRPGHHGEPFVEDLGR